MKKPDGLFKVIDLVKYNVDDSDLIISDDWYNGVSYERQGRNIFLYRIKSKKKAEKKEKDKKKKNKYKYFKVVISGNLYEERETFTILNLNEAVELYFTILSQSKHVNMQVKKKKKHLLMEDRKRVFNNTFANEQNEYIKSLEQPKKKYVKEIKDLSSTVMIMTFEEAFPYIRTTNA